MNRSTSVVFSVLLLVCCVATIVVASAPEIERRLVVVGDLHGDVEQALAILQMSQVTDKEGNWIPQAVPTTVVQMGDLVDRGVQDKQVVELFAKLKETAPEGSKVVVIMGNHEMMQLSGQHHYVHPEAKEAFGGPEHFKAALKEGESYGDFMRSLPLTHVDMDTLFVHAGLMPAFVEGEGDAETLLGKLNEQGKAAIEAKEWSAPVFQTAGPIWTRTLITKAKSGVCEDVYATLDKLGLKRMVVGHTPQRDKLPGIFCDDRLIAVDVGISKWMYGGLAAVEFELAKGETEPLISEVLPASAEDPTTPTDETSASQELNPQDAAAADLTDLQKALREDPTMLQEMLDTLQEERAIRGEKVGEEPSPKSAGGDGGDLI